MDWSTTEILAGALVVITGVYAALTFGIMRATRRSVDAMQQQTEALTRPYITISPMILPHNHLILLRIANTGKTAASRVRLQLDRPFYRFGEHDEAHNIATFSAFTNEIATISPGTEFIFALAQGPVVLDEKADRNRLPLTFNVSSTYTFPSRTITEVTEVDLRPFRGMHMAHDAVVNQLSEIKDVLEKRE
jgi:hypothetical protein